MPVANSCGGCATWDKETGLCHLHSPAPSTGEEIDIVYWPKVAETDRCAHGDTQKRPVLCSECAFFYQPNGEPLQPYYGWGMPPEWWAASGLCIASGPAPQRKESQRVYWGVVSQLDGKCRDGKIVEPANTSTSTVVVVLEKEEHSTT